jgi:hypothetical protein
MQKFKLLVALTALSAIFLQDRSCCGQTIPGSMPGDLIISGSWSGVTSETIMDYSQYQLIDTTELSFADTLSISFDVNVDNGIVDSVEGYGLGVSFGAQGGGGTIISFEGGTLGSDTANFFVTYQSILPDGTIDTSIGSATADFTFVSGLDGAGNGDLIFASFTTVPEPSSIVMGTLGTLATVLLIWARGRRGHRAVSLN